MDGRHPRVVRCICGLFSGGAVDAALFHQTTWAVVALACAVLASLGTA